MRATTNRRALNKERTRKAILDAARDGIARNGVQATTLDDIAMDAGISRSTLFNYFSGKGEIMDQLVSEMQASFFASVEECKSRISDVPRRIRALFEASGRSMDATAQGLRPLVGYSETGWNEGGAVERIERVTNSFEELLDGRGAEFLSAQDRHAVAEIMTHVFIGNVHSWRLIADYPLEARLREAAQWICLMVESRRPA